MINDPESCGSCGGRGWKVLGYRRSHERAGSLAEGVPAIRRRVACLFCQPVAGRADRAITSEGS
jgi:hypothetical protein